MTAGRTRVPWRAPVLGLAGLAQLVALTGHSWADAGGVKLGVSGGLFCPSTCETWSWSSMHVGRAVSVLGSILLVVGLVTAAVTFSAAIAAARRRLGPRVVIVACGLAALTLVLSGAFAYFMMTAFNHRPAPLEGLFTMAGGLVAVFVFARPVRADAGDEHG